MVVASARVIVPALLRVFSVSSPPSASVAPDAMVTPEVFARRASPMVASVPASTDVEPA